MVDKTAGTSVVRRTTEETGHKRGRSREGGYMYSRTCFFPLLLGARMLLLWNHVHTETVEPSLRGYAYMSSAAALADCEVAAHSPTLLRCS